MKHAFFYVGLLALAGSPNAQATDTNDTWLGIDTNVHTATDKNANLELASEPNHSKDQASLFYECASIRTNITRLACFDKVAQAGTLPNFIKEKKPIDLGQTLIKTFKGDPQVVLAGSQIDSSINNSINNSSINNNTPNNSINNSTVNLDGDNKQITDTITALDPTADGASLPLAQNEQYILSTVGIKENDIGKYSPLSLAYDLDKNSDIGTWKPRPHNPMYMLPIQVHTAPNRSPQTPNQDSKEYSHNDRRNAELKLQVSVKTKVAEDLFNTHSDLWFGYTQQSHWQVYNEDNSRPFRATDYQPEIFITQPVTASLPFNGRLRMLGAGLIHHSNGEDDPLSRSWNRAYVMAGAEWNKLTLVPKFWARINARTNNKPDDNPNISEHWGIGELRAYYDLDKKNSISGMIRGNPSTQKGAVELEFIHQLDNNVNVYLQVFHGYGESIIDYNHKDTAVGMGIMLNDWRGL